MYIYNLTRCKGCSRVRAITDTRASSIRINCPSVIVPLPHSKTHTRNYMFDRISNSIPPNRAANRVIFAKSSTDFGGVVSFAWTILLVGMYYREG